MAKTAYNSLNIKVISSIFGSFLISCSTNIEYREISKEEGHYIIKPSKYDSIPEEDKIYYGDHNFILTSNKAYYNNKYVEDWCGMGVNYSKALMPDEIEEIGLDSLKLFLDRKIKENRIKEHTSIILAS